MILAISNASCELNLGVSKASTGTFFVFISEFPLEAYWLDGRKVREHFQHTNMEMSKSNGAFGSSYGSGLWSALYTLP